MGVDTVRRRGVVRERQGGDGESVRVRERGERGVEAVSRGRLSVPDHAAAGGASAAVLADFTLLFHTAILKPRFDLKFT